MKSASERRRKREGSRARVYGVFHEARGILKKDVAFGTSEDHP